MPSPTGLTSAQAEASRAEHGRNTMPVPRRPSLLGRFLGQLVHFFALMLWVAAVLAFVDGMPQLGIAIIAVVLLNAVFSFIQEGRADRAAERLRTLLPARVTVWRDGRQREIEADELVVGDLVDVEPGDRVSLTVLLVPPFASALGQGTPVAAGWMVAGLAPFALLAVDAADKWHRRRTRRYSSNSENRSG